MFQPTLLVRGPFFDRTVELVRQLAEPCTVIEIRTTYAHNVVVMREQLVKLLLSMGVAFEYRGPHIVLPNRSQFKFIYDRGASPVVTSC